MSGSASRRPAARPAPHAAGKPRAAGRKRSGPARAPRFAWAGRWGISLALALAVLLLLPIVHAFAGDLGVLVVGTGGLGFLLGRWSVTFP